MTIANSDSHSGKRGGARLTTIINESGLYALVLRSRKPEARKFAKWVTSEVLPAIRKTGSYTAQAELPYLITVEQQGLIHTAIGERFPEGKARPYAWSRFNAHFKIASYKHLPAPKFDEALAYIAGMPRKEAPKAIPERIPVRKVGDLSFFCKSDRHNQPGAASTWWDYPQELKKLEWSEGCKVGRGFFAEVAELAEHDEHAAYLVLESVLGIAWAIPSGSLGKNSCIEYGFAQAIAAAMMTGLRAIRGGATPYAWSA